ncbi:HAMP domain-containing histidine kinase [Fulvivirga sp. RKSG066]|uniref:sensor histidine kinase n=1 Tax=Fulvivirga aurantia TaxID=2529383 RepID=UPI0012BC1EC4|nr:HAMP domain-containing sensor histidine kinase [Fulvivirga aurantia]MTI21524.1 HAMP domain-containing histidine kinase [Fulvivirga aurantia]
MKLILKITILYLFISLLVFALGGIITFEVIKREVDLEQQRFLKERLNSAIRMIERRNLDKPFKRDKISILPLAVLEEETEIIYSDTIVMHSTLQRMEPHVKLDVIKNVKGRSYKISMFDLIVEEDDIAEGVQESLIKMYILLTVVVLILSGVASFFLLKPFNHTLQIIKNFRLSNNEDVKFSKSSTSEFNKLNIFLGEMTLKMRRDYLAMKEFTENASHEMQTPLTIASGKLEMLLNADNLTDEQMSMIVSAQDSIRRLSKMNKSLSLLTKIENKEFESKDEVNLSAKLEQQIFDFEELINLKSIKLHKDITGNVKLKIDDVLCNILLTNLLQNAVRHNFEEGEIYVNLTTDELSITNTGNPLLTDPDVLFDRFKKGNQSAESIGLGLAIVKKICDANGFEVDYIYANGKHKLTVSFQHKPQ